MKPAASGAQGNGGTPLAGEQSPWRPQPRYPPVGTMPTMVGRYQERPPVRPLMLWRTALVAVTSQWWSSWVCACPSVGAGPRPRGVDRKTVSPNAAPCHRPHSIIRHCNTLRYTERAFLRADATANGGELSPTSRRLNRKARAGACLRLAGACDVMSRDS